MRMRNTKYCIVEVPSKQVFFSNMTRRISTMYGMLWCTSCLRIPIDREESNGRKHKGITMAQWKNSLRNKDATQ